MQKKLFLHVISDCSAANSEEFSGHSGFAELLEESFMDDEDEVFLSLFQVEKVVRELFGFVADGLVERLVEPEEEFLVKICSCHNG
ncbi:MAG: hypothetical protein IJT08_04265 [Alphaproteobacteria bacterium]|nr:hypothetical protein [Alphaproteobacteria bacterium]